jgi:large subunit ribosomal protein L15
MNLHSLKPAKGAVKSRKRIARGQGSGRGGTSTRGHKGAKSRSGYKSKRAFEGGQMPLQMRLPKRGFKNPNRVEYVPINLDRLSAIAERSGSKDISVESLYSLGVIKKRDRVKVLGNGDLTSKINVTVHAISASAKEAIEGKGGVVTIL